MNIPKNWKKLIQVTEPETCKLKGGKNPLYNWFATIQWKKTPRGFKKLICEFELTTVKDSDLHKIREVNFKICDKFGRTDRRYITRLLLKRLNHDLKFGKPKLSCEHADYWFMLFVLNPTEFFVEIPLDSGSL